jgi:hypothetical protein
VGGGPAGMTLMRLGEGVLVMHRVFDCAQGTVRPFERYALSL